MKKIILAAAALVAGLAANAVGFDYTTTSIYDTPISSVFTNLNNVTIQQTSAPGEGQVTGKNNINVTTGGIESTFEMGGIVWSYLNSNDGNTIAKQYGNYVQPNGKDRYLTIPTTAGDVVTVTVVEAATGVSVTGAAEGTSIDLAAGANTLTATGTSIVLKTVSTKPKFQAITVSGSSAVNEAAAEGAKEVVARVGLVNVYNDGSKELAK